MRGSAAELAERYAGAPPRGEVVLVLAPDRAQPTRGPEAPRSTRCGGWWTRAPSRAAAAAVVAGADRGSANALYRALTSGD